MLEIVNIQMKLKNDTKIDKKKITKIQEFISFFSKLNFSPKF